MHRRLDEWTHGTWRCAFGDLGRGGNGADTYAQQEEDGFCHMAGPNAFINVEEAFLSVQHHVDATEEAAFASLRPVAGVEAAILPRGPEDRQQDRSSWWNGGCPVILAPALVMSRWHCFKE